MTVKQISIFLDNKEGRLSFVTECLANAGINISALSIADTTNFGILRLIVNDPDKAVKVLYDNGITVSKTDVLAVAMGDEPGSLAKVLKMLTDSKLSIEYAYAFATRKSGCAMVVLKIEEIVKAEIVLTNNGVKVYSESEVYGL